MLRKFKITVDGTEYLVEMEEIGGSPAPTAPVAVPTPPVTVASEPVAPTPTPAPVASAPAGADTMPSPMPGTMRGLGSPVPRVPQGACGGPDPGRRPAECDPAQSGRSPRMA